MGTRSWAGSDRKWGQSSGSCGYHLLRVGPGERHLPSRSWLGDRLHPDWRVWDGGSAGGGHAQAAPTPEDIQAAINPIQDLQSRLEKARLTWEARRDPIRLQLLDQGLLELGIPAPQRRLAITLACFNQDAIVRGLALFGARREARSIPPNAEHSRHPGGIIRNLHHQFELERIADHILCQRLRLRDLTLEPLHRDQQEIRTALHPGEPHRAFLDCALDAQYTIDDRFWSQAAADALETLPVEMRCPTYRALTLRIAASFKVDHAGREDLIDRLAGAVALAA